MFYTLYMLQVFLLLGYFIVQTCFCVNVDGKSRHVLPLTVTVLLKYVEGVFFFVVFFIYIAL